MIVNIADVNDNSPVVTTSSYIEEVKENLPSGLSVMKVNKQKQETIKVNKQEFIQQNRLEPQHRTHVKLGFATIT